MNEMQTEELKKMLKPFTCRICGNIINDEYGNDPYPVRNDGRCCNKCNNLVIMYRLINRIHKESEI